MGIIDMSDFLLTGHTITTTLPNPHLIFITKDVTERKGHFSQFITQTVNPDTVQGTELGSVGKRKMTSKMFPTKMCWEE